ncbi:MAG: glycosyltransferase [Candidatus Micrarchaeia archaeon]
MVCALIRGEGNMRYSIIVPAYKKEAEIGNMLHSYLEYFRKKGGSFEFLVVCDDEATAGVAKKFREMYKEVIVIENKSRVGKGKAIQIGLEKANSEIVGFVDGDFSVEPYEFAKLIEEIEKNEELDCVIGSRWMKGSKLEQKILRKVASRAFNLILRIILGFDYADTQCGAKVLRRRVLPIVKEAKIGGFAFDIELLLLLKKNGCTIKEVPIRWVDRGRSTVTIFDIAIMFIDVLRIRRYYL